MKKNRVLITGVAGFIGSNLLDFLLEKTDWLVDGIDNFSTGSKANIQHVCDSPRFTFMHGNCSDINTVTPYKYIFHLAALPRIQPSFEFIVEHVNANLNQSLCLFELMIKEAYFPRIIYSSSSAIYGTPQGIPTKEDERIDCLSPYAFQKYEVEKYLELLSNRYPFDYVNLRYFNPYGPRSFNPDNKFNAYSSVVGIFLNRQKNNLPLLVTGNGEQRRDFIHVRDIADANLKAAVCPNKLNMSFNIGNGTTISVIDLARMISQNLQFVPKREGESEITFADTKKARQILNWAPTSSLKEYITANLS